jgi:EpsI family protein
MNSFRIGVIGVLVEYYGPSMAEGFLHDFEGWFVFMACLALLLIEIVLLTRLTGDKRPFAEIFSIDWPEPVPAEGDFRSRRLPAPFLAGVAVLVTGVGAAHFIVSREEVIPARPEFSEFPLTIGSWTGTTERLDRVYVDALKFDDYYLADYRSGDGAVVNFYVAYYGSQRKGESAHSPRSCLPGGGWEISSIDQKTLDATISDGVPIEVNRAVIRKGESTQLVYYWFQGRGRVVTNEYLVKWYLFWDALTKHRTDGALVRLTTMVAPGESLQEAERALSDFARQVSGSFFIALVVTMALIPPLMRVAHSISVVDTPNERKVHTSIMPRIGGMAMVVGACIPILFWLPHDRMVVALLVALLVLLVFGAWDDSKELDYRVKFLGQFIAVFIIVLWGGVRITVFPFAGIEPVPVYLSIPVSVIFLVGVTNAVNLSDGLDGLAAGVTLLSLGAIAFLAQSRFWQRWRMASRQYCFVSS